MMNPEFSQTEESLDPSDWDGLRRLAHRMVDDMLDSLQDIRQRPTWQPIPAEVKVALQQPLPQEAQPPEQVYQEFLETIFPHPMGNIHPRFWGWVIGTGTPFSVLAEMMAAAMNPNLGGGDHVPNYVEEQVLDWCKQMLGYPAEASGILVSGGSMANLLGLAVGRVARAGFDVRTLGQGAAPRPMSVYASSETHSSVQKAVELMGLGSQALRKIPVDADFRIDLAALETRLAADRQAGWQPFCLVGNAGTVNTGAFDDLQALAEISEREELWYHVDGAFGALAALSPKLRPLTEGMARADSLAFDLHKWFGVPIEAGCVLVRDRQAHRAAFALTPAYLAQIGRGLAGGSQWYNDYGIQLTRGFRALKVWMSLKEHGVQKFGRLIHQNVEQASFLANLVDADPKLERLAPAPLNIVCFRYNPGGLDDEALNELNRELLARLQERGIAAPSYTTLGGRFALRVANVNHRSRREDFEILVQAVDQIGAEISPATST